MLSIADDLGDFMRKRKATPLHGDPIIIASVPRSGSTMLAELLNSPQVMYYHEPFLKHNILWNPELAQRLTTTPADEETIRTRWAAIRDQQAWSFYRKSHSRYPYLTKGALHKYLSLSPRRILLKGPSLSYWLDTLLNITGPAFVILLFRDPRAITASLKRLNWDPFQRLNLIYTHPWFKNRLPTGAEDYRERFAEMTPVERMALQTAILHNFLIRNNQVHPDHHSVYFEELVRSPEETLHRLVSAAGLPADYVTPAHIQEILNAEDRSTWQHRFRRKGTEHINKWQSTLTAFESESVLNIYTSINPKYPIN